MAETEYVTKQWIKTNDDGHVDVLFVLPFEQRSFDENVLSNQYGGELRDAIENFFDSFAVVTMKKTSGPWADSNIEPHVQARIPWLKKKVDKLKPNVVVFLGANLARFVIPEVRDYNAFDLMTSFQRWKLDKTTEQLCFVYMQPQALFRDYEQKTRLTENLSKIYVASRGLGYHEPGKYENLEYSSAKSYLKHLIHDYRGRISFDTETYSLNQVNNTQLGAMQFSTCTQESKVMLWDTDKSSYSK